MPVTHAQSRGKISVVVVTGASGFIGSHIVKACLARGYHVNACVRDKHAPKNTFLRDMARGLPGTIELYSADLLAAGAYDVACSTAQAVIHAAAQVDPSHIKDPWKDMVEPSVQGVRNILSSVDKNAHEGGIVAFVQTSSMASVGGAAGRQATEADWSTFTIEDEPYAFAKRSGEEAVWEFTKGKPYAVAAINPSMVFGPCLAKPHCKASPFVFRQAIFGNPQPNTPYSIVDVRDVATAHVEAMVRPEADGKRFILDGDEAPMAVNQIIATCRQLFPAVQFGDAPGPKGWDEALFGARQPSRSPTDNSRSRSVLGIDYIAAEHTIRDTVASIIHNGFVPITPAAGRGATPKL